MERTPLTDPALRTGGSEPAWTQLPQLNSGVCGLRNPATCVAHSVFVSRAGIAGIAGPVAAVMAAFVPYTECPNTRAGACTQRESQESGFWMC